jgi:hypothetical protein
MERALMRWRGGGARANTPCARSEEVVLGDVLRVGMLLRKVLDRLPHVLEVAQGVVASERRQAMHDVRRQLLIRESACAKEQIGRGLWSGGGGRELCSRG